MKRVFKQSILRVKPYVPGKPIDEVKRELGLKDVIKLASNENPFDPSPEVFKAIQNGLKELNRYPDGDCYYLRRELASRLKVNQKQLIFGNGSDEIIVFAARAFLKEGDEVVIAKPSFLIYEIASEIEGAEIKAVPLKDFRYDLEGMKKAVSPKTKIIFIGNPDNPSGMYLTENQVREFLKAIPSNILIFMDEAYHEYVQAKDYVNSIQLLKEYKNLIVTRTFSKLYGLAALRVGYGIGSEELMDYLNRLREPFNVNSLAQAAALACLKDQRYYQGLLKKINEERQFLYQSFQRLGLKYIESCTNFILIDLPKEAVELAKKLLQQGIIVRDMSPWGLKRFIRVTIGTPEENKRLIEELEELV